MDVAGVVVGGAVGAAAVAAAGVVLGGFEVVRGTHNHVSLCVVQPAKFGAG